MGIFSSKKNKRSAPDVAVSFGSRSFPETSTIGTKPQRLAIPALGRDVLLRPHITEKAGIKASEENVYTFEVTKGASKPSIRKAIIDLYKVTPVKIATITITGKRVVMRGKAGITKTTKKALVYLKKGEKIEFV